MRRLRISRTTFIIGAIIGVTAAAAVPLAIGAIANQPTYDLSDASIQYPYDDPREEVPPDKGLAAVSFVATWPGGEFPGAANCELSLVGSDGSSVGTLAFDLVMGTDGERTPSLVVPVSAEPSDAEASCADSADEVASGAGYFFSGPTRVAAPVNSLTGEVLPNSTEVEFDVRWQGDLNPGFRTCYLTVSRSNGTSDEPAKYNVLVGEGPLTFDVEGAPNTVSGADVSCEPFKG